MSISSATLAPSLLSQTGGPQFGRRDPLAKLADANGDVSRADFVSNRPKGVSDEQAGKLFDSIDTGSAGKLNVDALRSGLRANRPDQDGPPPGEGPPPGARPPQISGATTAALSPSTVNALLEALQQLNDSLGSTAEKTGAQANANAPAGQAGEAHKGHHHHHGAQPAGQGDGDGDDKAGQASQTPSASDVQASLSKFVKDLQAYAKANVLQTQATAPQTALIA